MLAASFFLLVFPAFAQNQAAAPVASTETAVAVSSGAPDAQGHGLKTAVAPPVAVLTNPITVRIHKESADWDPVAVRVGGDPSQAVNSFAWRVRKGRTKNSKTAAVARVHPHKEDKMLIIALYPTSLKRRGTYFEVRYLISEGWLDEAKVAAVTVKASPRFRWGEEDTFTMAKKGIEFSEDFPAAGSLRISALDPRPGKTARNSGKITGADFGGNAYDKDALHVVNFSYAVTGVNVMRSHAAVDWVTIPGGAFNLHNWGTRVRIKTLKIARTLVTNKQYMACVDAGACTAPHYSDKTCSYFTGSDWKSIPLPDSFLDDDHPVVCVEWDQANDYAHWVGGRLPSESEWEFAARSRGEVQDYPWGNEKPTCQLAVIAKCGDSTQPVCSTPSGNTEQGLCDMSGNAQEWMEDWFHDRGEGSPPADGRAWLEHKNSNRVIKGGSWVKTGSAWAVDLGKPSLLGYPGARSCDLGFRPVRSR